MNYIKPQQEILADILTDAPRNVMYHRDGAHEQVTIFNRLGTFGHVIPEKLVAVNLVKCSELKKFPFPICPIDKEKEIVTDGVTVPRTDRKGTLLIFKTKQGAARYVDKKLRDKFGKDARFYQEKDLGVITVAEGGATIGYVCPCRAPKHIEIQ